MTAIFKKTFVTFILVLAVLLSAFTALFVSPVQAVEEEKEYYLEIKFSGDSLIYDSKNSPYNSNQSLFLEFEFYNQTTSTFNEINQIIDVKPFITNSVSFSNSTVTAIDYSTTRTNFVRLEFKNGIRFPVSKEFYEHNLAFILGYITITNRTTSNGLKDVSFSGNPVCGFIVFGSYEPPENWSTAELILIKVLDITNKGFNYSLLQFTLGSSQPDKEPLYKITVLKPENSASDILFQLYSTQDITNEDLDNMKIYYGWNKYVRPNNINVDFIELQGGFLNNRKYSAINFYTLEFYITLSDLLWFNSGSADLDFVCNDIYLYSNNKLNAEGKILNVKVTEMSSDFEEPPPKKEIKKKNKTPYFDKIKKVFNKIGSGINNIIKDISGLTTLIIIVFVTAGVYIFYQNNKKSK